MTPLVEIKNLKTHFFTEEGVVKSVDGVSLTIPKGKTLGLVGESGCGKSVTALSVIRLVSHPGRIVDGEILFHENGKVSDLTKLPEAELRKVRGGKIAMIFQEPMTSLNPVFTIGDQIMEAVLLHQNVNKAEARHRAIEALRKVEIPTPEQRLKDYPHQFSGGMRQRAMIAMALACHPQLLIADEPSTALDVTIQAQLLDLLRKIQADTGMSILIITHDLGVIAETADDVAVMYASKVVEYASVRELFANPKHPYTHGLFNSRPKRGADKSKPLSAINGMVPSPLCMPTGCKFHPRCPYCQALCKNDEPVLRDLGESAKNVPAAGASAASQKPVTPRGHLAQCHFAEEIRYE